MGTLCRLLHPHQRVAIEAEIEQHLQRVTLLIDRLDQADAPFEDFEDDDPAGDTLDERGEGVGHMGQGLYKTLPLYGVDQSRGPINVMEAARAHHRHTMAG